MKIENNELLLTNRDISAIAARLKKETGLSHSKTIDAIADALGFTGGNAMMSLLKSATPAVVETQPNAQVADDEVFTTFLDELKNASFRPQAPIDQFVADAPYIHPSRERVIAELRNNPWVHNAVADYIEGLPDTDLDPHINSMHWLVAGMALKTFDVFPTFLDEFKHGSLWPQRPADEFIAFLREIDEVMLADYIAENPDLLVTTPGHSADAKTPRDWLRAIKMLKLVKPEDTLNPTAMTLIGQSIGETHRDALIERMKAS